MQNNINNATPTKAREIFCATFKNCINRAGSEQLLAYLEESDFFTAPASTRFHMSEEGGLVKHSINVYKRLRALYISDLECQRHLSPEEEETIAIVALLHDLCKIGCYKPGTRNVKNETTGQWEKVPVFNYEDTLPYGHGEKSVYIISEFMRLSREEAMAIRWHMGFSDAEGLHRSNVGNAFNQYRLAVLAHTADMLATYLDENTQERP